MLSDHWPLADLTREQVHDPESMPFTSPWTRAPVEQRPWNALRFWWGLRSSFDVNRWTLVFLVLDGGEPVGVQDVTATSFPVTRSVGTGSWLVRRHQGRGVGKEMRAAVLHLAFAGLIAAPVVVTEERRSPDTGERDRCGATASIAVTGEYELKTGGRYRNTGFITVRDGKIVETQVFFGGRV